MVLYGLYLTRKKKLKHYLEKLLCVLNANLDCHKFKTKCLNKVKKTTLNTYSWFYVIWHTILEEWILFWIRKHLIVLIILRDLSNDVTKWYFHSSWMMEKIKVRSPPRRFSVPLFFVYCTWKGKYLLVPR